MRSRSSVIAGFVATVVAIVTVPLLWVSVNVADEDGYVSLSTEIATDPELQEALAAYVADDFAQRGLLPGPLQELATTALTSAAQATTNRPGFIEAWQQTQRDLHASAFSDATGPIVVDVAPLANFVAERVSDQLPVSLRVESELPVQLGSAQDRERLRWVDQSRTWGLLGLMVVLVAAAVCILAARSRPLALAGLGLGALVAAGVLWLLADEVAPRLADESSSASEFAKSVQRLLIDRGAESLMGWLEPMAMIGCAAVLLGLAGHVISGRDEP